MWVKPAVSLNTIHLQQMSQYFLDIILHSPLSIWIRVYPDLVPSEVTVGVKVGGAPGLDADHVHIIAI